MKYPTTRFVFDRKGLAKKNIPSSVQVEILYKGKKKYISTGTKLCKGEWDNKRYAVNRTDIYEINARLAAFKKNIDDYINGLILAGNPFSWDEFDSFLTKAEDAKETFIAYAERRIEERTDIQETTRKSQRKLIRSLKEYNRIITFQDLTSGKILSYYEWLQGKTVTRFKADGTEYQARLSTNTIRDYMKFLKHYIHDAIAHEIIDHDPTVAVRVKRGDAAKDRYLTVEEVHRIINTKMPNGSVSRVRDLFILSCYTGLAYSDLMDLTEEKFVKSGDLTYIYGNRLKTGEEYAVLVLPEAERILKKYNYVLPQYSNYQYNKRLKIVADVAKIDKNISSHWGRHTAAMMWLNAGIRVEVVARALGHSTVKETQRTYSRVLQQTVVDEMKKML